MRDARDGRAVRRATGIYRRVLRAYPPAFRERHAAEMLRLFRDRARDARREGGAVRVALHLAGALADVARTAAAERWAGLVGSGSTRAGGGMDGLVKDARYALRSLGRSPWFTAVAVVTIALGIGANTAIFSVTRAVLLRPLDFEDPEELVVVWSAMQQRGVTDFPHSPPDMEDVREYATLFQGFATGVSFPQALTDGEGVPEQVQASGVSHDFFHVLGVSPAIGRDFEPADGEPVPQNTQPGDPGFLNTSVMLSHSLWQQRYGGDPGVLGRLVEVGGNPAEIVGVLPEGFEFLPPPGSTLRDADVWAAMRLDPSVMPRNNVFLTAVGRMSPGVTVEQANAELDRVAGRIRDEHASWETAGYDLEAEALHADLTEPVRPVILALTGAVAFVLLVACANVANLLLVRAGGRERELAVRAALGGSRRRLVRQLLAESAVLAGAGGVLGVILAALGIDLLVALQPADLPRVGEVRIDGTVLGFTAAAAVAAAFLFGLVPAAQASRPDLTGALKEGGRSAGLASKRALRSGVVVAEVALSLVLLVGAGLMVRSFVALQNEDPGFEPDGAMTFAASVPGARYPSPEERSAFQLRFKERLEGLPGVEAVGAAFPLPLEGQQANGRYGTREAVSDPSLFRQADYRYVLPGYFEAMGTRVLEGRVFTRADETDSASVAVVDRVLAERTWPGESAVGKRLYVRVSSPDPQEMEVIGVVEHQRSETLARQGRETVFVTDRFVGSFGNMRYVVRTASGDPASVVEPARRILAEMDDRIPLADVRPLSAYVDEAAAPTRFALVLIGCFAVLALLLASVGLYGVLSYLVGQRTAEIGVRKAFGAEAGSVMRLVVGEGMVLALVGTAVGLVVAAALTGVMSSLLVGVTPHDPLTFGGIAVLFLAVAAVACWVPAWRAMKVDPVEALRPD